MKKSRFPQSGVKVKTRSQFLHPTMSGHKSGLEIWHQHVRSSNEIKNHNNMFRFTRAALLIFAIAFFARYETLAFQQKLGTWTLPGSLKSKASPPPLAPNRQHRFQRRTDQSKHKSYQGEGENNNANDSRLLSRRGIMSGVFSLATSALWYPIKEASASIEEGIVPSASLKPFRVLFMVQIDSQKPNDLSEIEIEVRPDWAPLAAERFRNLVELGFYKDAPFFRVLPGYVAQFGISSDPKLNKQWVYCDTTDEEAKRSCQPNLLDEPRTQPNKKGTLSFASSGKNSRKTQIFINLANNDGPPNFLDAQNFVPFARIVRGMESDNNIPKRLNAGYGGKVNQGKAAYYGGEYFEAVFPKLSIIRDAKII